MSKVRQFFTEHLICVQLITHVIAFPYERMIMASALSARIVAAAAIVGLSSSLLAIVATPSAAIDYIPPTEGSTDIYIGMPFIWPQDRVTVANNQPGTWEYVRLFARDNKPRKDLKIIPVTPLPAGSVIQYDKGFNDWFLFYPADKPIPKTHIRYHVIDRDGQWSRAGHIIEVLAAPQPPSKPVPDPEPQANRGPVVDFRGASFPAGQNYEIHVHIADPEHHELGQVYLRADSGFKLRHLDDENWILDISSSVQPGMYEIGIQGEDDKGVRGEEVFAKVEILAPGANPTLPMPGPGLSTVPQTGP